MSTCFSRWQPSGPQKNAEQFLWLTRNVALLDTYVFESDQAVVICGVLWISVPAS